MGAAPARPSPTRFDAPPDDLAAPPAPFHRHDPSTSRIAAARVNVSVLRRRVLLALRDAGERGLTDDELAGVTGIDPPHSAATRRGEMTKAGYVEATGGHRPTSRGNPAKVWRLTADGRAKVAELERGQ